MARKLDDNVFQNCLLPPLIVGAQQIWAKMEKNENGEKVGQKSVQTHWNGKPQEGDLKTKQ